MKFKEVVGGKRLGGQPMSLPQSVGAVLAPRYDAPAMRLLISITIVLIASYAGNTPAKGLKDSKNELQGRVSHVSDGDTLWVKSADGVRHKVRFEGIDAPEVCQPHGKESQLALRAKLYGRTVQVNGNRRDDYGRLLGRVQLDGADMGAWMVGNGHAWSYRYRWSDGPYAAQERQAQDARLGLFALPSPERPGAFRKRHGPCPLPSSLSPTPPPRTSP